jgi:MoaA/NifB/PqqE/SkfB family radical SAM enzyme
MNFCKTNKTNIINVELKLADFQKHFTDDFCSRTKKVMFGGKYGDPIAASELLEITQYLCDRGVQVTMSTNGSLRNPAWWTALGKAMLKTNGILELHIDGLEDTNHLYRVKTKFNKIIENAKAYIETGATADWCFIIFKHNQHQVEEAFNLSREMGFNNFTLIDTARFKTGPKFHYVMPDGEKRFLEEGTIKASNFKITGDKIERHDEVVSKSSVTNSHKPSMVNGINCKSAGRNAPYISARGQVSACCWIAGLPEEANLYKKRGVEILSHNLNANLLENIMLSEPFLSYYKDAWEEGSLPRCIEKCGNLRRNKRLSL